MRSPLLRVGERSDVRSRSKRLLSFRFRSLERSLRYRQSLQNEERNENVRSDRYFCHFYKIFLTCRILATLLQLEKLPFFFWHCQKNFCLLRTKTFWTVLSLNCKERSWTIVLPPDTVPERSFSFRSVIKCHFCWNEQERNGAQPWSWSFNKGSVSISWLIWSKAFVLD